MRVQALKHGDRNIKDRDLGSGLSGWGAVMGVSVKGRRYRKAIQRLLKPA
ncbi:MAG: hypothetical protein JWL90_716 [Chthoniobacteraceae bacterium]|nr:hypothetical protein [Chthoniobacteraceae bacterium]